MNLGEIIDDPSINMKKHRIYQEFDNYFRNPVLYKIKDIKQYSMYITPVRNMISESRYIIVFINKDNHPVGFQIPLKNLEWISLQTNIILNTTYQLPKHTYTPTLNTVLNTPIKLVKTSTDSYEYKCPKFDINVSLILDDKNKYYVHSGNLVNAIETYRTIITWT